MFWGQEDNFLLRGIVMEKWAGLGIILLDIIAMAVLYIHINRKGVLKRKVLKLMILLSILRNMFWKISLTS